MRFMSKLGAVVLTLLLALMLLPTPIAAVEQPPMTLSGYVYIGVERAPNGTLVEAKIGDTIVDSCGTITTSGDEQGYYALSFEDGIPDKVYLLVKGTEADEIAYASGHQSLNLYIPALPTEPTIAFTLTSLSFSAVEGGDNPADQTLEIWNSGTGTLAWSVSDDAAWLSLSPPSGSSTAGEHNSVTISVDITDMSADDYSAIITISALGATNTPRTVPVRLHISAAPEPDIYYTLTVNISPSGGGSVSPSSADYAAGTSVELTATPNEGYAFGSWSVALTGSINPDTIIMDSAKSVTANFVKFTAPEDVDVAGAGAGVDSIDVSSINLSEVDTTNMPEDIETQEAYVVDSTGTGSFTLRFTDIANASDIAVYKVVDSTWTELTATGSGTTLEVTIPAGDPTLVFALPTAAPSNGGGGAGGTAYLPDKLAIIAPYILLSLGIILAGGIIWLVLRRRRA